MTDRKPMQEELLDKVAGGISGGHPAKDSNNAEFTKKALEMRWEKFKQEPECNVKDKELELKAKEMWLKAIMDGTGRITDIAKLFMGGK